MLDHTKTLAAYIADYCNEELSRAGYAAGLINQDMVSNAISAFEGGACPNAKKYMVEAKPYMQFEELSEEAKEKAIAWFADGYPDHEWWDCIYEDAGRVGLKITEFDLDRNRHAKGRFIDDAESCAKTIIAEHGQDCETYKTAKAFLMSLQSLEDEYGDDGEGNLISSIDGQDNYTEEKEELEAEFLKSILEDYAIMLQNECDHLQSREHIEEMITINEYEFNEDGSRA